MFHLCVLNVKWPHRKFQFKSCDQARANQRAAPIQLKWMANQSNPALQVASQITFQVPGSESVTSPLILILKTTQLSPCIEFISEN